MRTLRSRHLATLLGSLAAVTLAAAPAQRQSAATPSHSLAVVRVETNASASPLGIDDPAPRLSWVLRGAGRGIVQTSYRVLVASRPELLREGRADVWDSGQVQSADPWARYGGPALRPRTRYHWSVRVSGAGEQMSDWSRPAWFETAFFRATDWRGHWIAGPERQVTPLAIADGTADDDAIRKAGEFCRPVRWLTSGFAARLVPNNQGECREVRPAPMLRKTFRVTKPVVRARVHATGLAYNDLWINGSPASARLLDPGFTDYAETVLYTTDDVTSLLRQGDNVIASMLGSGQYDNAARIWDWSWDQTEWRSTPRLRLDLYISYADGTEDVVASDGTWRVSTAGPIRYDNYYFGETYDARRPHRADPAARLRPRT